MDSDRHRRAQELFEEAEALPADERETFLLTSCGDDPTLYRHVTDLLEAAAEMPEDFLEPPGSTPPSTSSRVGETLSHYRILEPLGAGGMGEVYLAEDERLKRRVALKVLPPELAGSPERLERFQREAEALAALNHPNIVTIYSIENERGLQFLTMELIDGPSLRQLLDHSGALPIEDVLDLGVQIAEGLAEAHAAGIVHRDLKPGNVMVAANDRVKLLDFGLARPGRPLGGDDEAADLKASLTKEGAILGTIAYMSPEQLMGRRVDSRSDIFSLGILLFELATGKHPFPAETEASALAKILEREPEDLHEARPAVPGELARIVARCLAKDPAKRYQDTTQLVRELKGLRHGEGAGVSPARGLAERGRPALLRRPRLLAAAATLAAVLGAVGIWRWMTPPESGLGRDEPLSVAVLPLRNISADPEDSDYLAEGIGQAVITKLTQAGLRVAPWQSVQRAHVDLPLKEVARELGVESVLTGTFQLADERIRATLSLSEAATGFQVWAHDFDEPFEDIFAIQGQIALEAAERLKGRLTPEEQESLALPESADLDAYDFYLQGAHLLQAEDPESAEVARQYFEQALEIDPELVDAHIGLGAFHSMRYFNSWAGPDELSLSEASYLAALRLDAASMRARRGLMNIETERGRTEEVLIHAREARRAGRPNDIESLYAEAEGYSRSALSELSRPIFERILELDPLNEGASWWLVLGAAWSGDYEAAVQAGEAHLSKFGDDAIVHTYVGVSLYALGRLERAEEHYQKAMEGLQLSTSFHALVFRGHLQQQSGREEEAVSTWTAGLEASRSRQGVGAESPRLVLQTAILETCLYGAPSGEPLREILDQGKENYWEVPLLAAALAKQGDWQRSVELLHTTLDRGLVPPLWRAQFAGLGSDPDGPEWAGFRQALEARRLELRQRFGPSDPLEAVSAR